MFRVSGACGVDCGIWPFVAKVLSLMEQSVIECDLGSTQAWVFDSPSSSVTYFYVLIEYFLL